MTKIRKYFKKRGGGIDYDRREIPSVSEYSQIKQDLYFSPYT